MPVDMKSVLALRHRSPQPAVGNRLPARPPVVGLGHVVRVERVGRVGRQDVGQGVGDGVARVGLHLDPVVAVEPLQHDAREIDRRISTLPDELCDAGDPRNLEVGLQLAGHLKRIPQILGNLLRHGPGVRGGVGIGRLKVSHGVHGVGEVAVRVMGLELVGQQVGRHHVEVALHDVLTLERAPDIDVRLVAAEPVFWDEQITLVVLAYPVEDVLGQARRRLSRILLRVHLGGLVGRSRRGIVGRREPSDCRMGRGPASGRRQRRAGRGRERSLRPAQRHRR